jgi:hypothetical protein
MVKLFGAGSRSSAAGFSLHGPLAGVKPCFTFDLLERFFPAPGLREHQPDHRKSVPSETHTSLPVLGGCSISAPIQQLTAPNPIPKRH